MPLAAHDDRSPMYRESLPIGPPSPPSTPSSRLASSAGRGLGTPTGTPRERHSAKAGEVRLTNDTLNHSLISRASKGLWRERPQKDAGGVKPRVTPSTFIWRALCGVESTGPDKTPQKDWEAMDHLENHYRSSASAGAFFGIHFPFGPIFRVRRGASLVMRRKSIKMVNVFTSAQRTWTEPETSSKTELDGRESSC